MPGEDVLLGGESPVDPKAGANPRDRGPLVSEQLSARSSAQARVVFDTFRSTDDPMLASWLSFRARILPAETGQGVVAPRASGPVARGGMYGVWRLLATNNRELGRGTWLYPAPDDAWADAEVLSARAGELSPTTVRGDVPTRHAWALRLGGLPVLISSRWYESPGEAAAAARATRDHLGRAHIARVVNIGTRSGRRYRQVREEVPLLG